MKKILTLIIILILTNSAFGQQTLRTLFIGNSYTYYNNAPQLVADMAQSVGDTLIFSSNLPGGSSLQAHASNATTLQEIKTGNWDYVILQDQSQRPARPIAQVQTQVFPYAQALNDSILAYNPCAETMFYMTWGRQNGDANNCATWPPVCTYEGMDSLLRLRYEMMATMNKAELAPVGAVWRYIRNNHPNLNLYANDGSHPSAAGSYAAACTFYTSMFRKDPTAITFDFSLNAADALAIRNAVKVIVFDDLLAWNIGTYDPMPSFTFTTVDSADFTFINTSTNADTYFWDFGDGNTSTEDAPTNGYGNYGHYTVTLSAIRCGDTVTTSTTLTAYVVATEPLKKETIFQLSPNPTSDIVYIKTVIQDYRVQVLNGNGQLLLETKASEINLSNYPKGIYFIKIEFDGQQFVQQVLRN